MVGVRKLYDYFQEHSIPVKCHAHDNNASVSKCLKEEHPDVEDAKDTWHATKGAGRDAKKICSGPVYQEGKKWHPELCDKAAAIRSHLFWCMKN